MAKNPLITESVRGVISDVYKDNMDCPAKQIRDKVEARLRGKNFLIKPGWPGLSAVQKELTKIREKEETKPPEQHRLDRPWSIGCLVERDIPPEVLPIVLDIYQQYLQQEFNKLANATDWTSDYLNMKLGQKFTVRLVLWIARLYKYFDDYNDLWRFARLYARQEQVDWILGRDPCTREIDIWTLFYQYAEMREEMANSYWFIRDKEGTEEGLKMKGSSLEKIRNLHGG